MPSPSTKTRRPTLPAQAAIPQYPRGHALKLQIGETHSEKEYRKGGGTPTEKTVKYYVASAPVPRSFAGS